MVKESWGELLRDYERSKRGLDRPELARSVERPARVTYKQKFEQDARFDPVLQTHTAADAEAAARRDENKTVVERLNRARDRQIANEAPFDIISMHDKREGLSATLGSSSAHSPAGGASSMSTSSSPHYSVAPEVPKLRHPLDSTYPYNLLSGLSLSEHHYRPPEHRPVIADPMATAKPRLQSTQALPRDYNVLTGRYVRGHDDKVRLEAQMSRRAAAQKYWETHHYDIFTCKFHDPADESEMRSRAATIAGRQPTLAFNRLPPTLKKAEGLAFDITTHVVKDPELMSLRQADAQPKHGSRRPKWEQEQAMTDRGQRRAQLADTRGVNRTSHARFVNEHGKGYDLLNPALDSRHNAFNPPAPRSRGAPSLWDMLSDTG